MELNEEERVLEVLHEFLVVNPLVSINVSYQHHSDDFTVRELNRCELFETVLELQWLQEAFIIFIKVSEHFEQVEVFVDWHLDILRLKYTKLYELSLSTGGFSGEHSFNESFQGFTEL